MDKLKIDWDKSGGLVPAIAQDFKSNEVYMLGYMNEEALTKTFESGWVHFWSRSKKRIWMKGEESGNKLKIVETYQDCDADTLLLKVELVGECVCHTGHKSCFYTKLNHGENQ